jgi:MoxR-like ATPase
MSGRDSFITSSMVHGDEQGGHKLAGKPYRFSSSKRRRVVRILCYTSAQFSNKHFPCAPASSAYIVEWSVTLLGSIQVRSDGVEDPKIIAERIIDNVQKVVIGKEGEVRLTVVCLLCAGHLLIEDVPGVGKTTLARSLAKSTGCEFKRIQFTPDILPSDVTGVSVYNMKTSDFEFRAGPISAQIVLADEINRATPKTQSALLEAMEEHRVTVDGITRDLPEPFMVLATQNPIEYEGTFPLPEAQMDRFLMRVHLGYPTMTDEVLMMDSQQTAHPVETLAQVTDASEIIGMQRAVKEIYVDPLIKQYIVAIVDMTRQHESVYLGASPRGSLALYRTAQARALLDGRDYVIPDDVKELAYATLGHRVIVSPSARVKSVSSSDIILGCLERVPVPGARARGGQPR